MESVLEVGGCSNKEEEGEKESEQRDRERQKEMVTQRRDKQL